MSAISSPGKSAPRRPNGRLQACDPCRRRKVACDHTQPVCNRCRARNQAKSCVYLAGGSKPTPLGTRPTNGAGTFDFNTTIEELSPSLPASDDTQSSSVLDRSSVAADGRFHHNASPSIDMSSGTGSGFLGATSHSAVYGETTQTLSLLQGFQACLSVSGEPKQHQRSKSAASEVLLSPTREMCLVVLRSIPSPLDGHIALRMSPHPYDGWARVAAQRILKSLYDRFGKYLGSNRIDSQLEEVAIALSNNTSQPFSDKISDPDQWIDQFSGINLRWESLGLIFSFKELGQERQWKRQDGESEESLRKHWPEVARVCLGLTIDLARRFSDGNSILLQLCIRRTIAESLVTGDASKLTTRALGLVAWTNPMVARSLLLEGNV